MKVSRSTLPIFLALILLSSCIPHKKILYLQDKGDTEMKGDTLVYHQTDYRLKPGDFLYIRILSMDEKVSDFFNIQSGVMQQGIGQEGGMYYYSYKIDDEGNLTVPYLGVFSVNNLTLKELETLLQAKLDQFLNDATVIVRMVNFNITLLGEVNNPGKLNIYQEKINIFQAIGMAGDLTDFGNRSDIQLIRKSDNGAIIEHLDLNDQNIINSPFYWLMPDDILYVERLKSKPFISEAFPYTLIFSIITTTLLITNYFK